MQVRPDSLEGQPPHWRLQIGEGKLQNARQEMLASNKKWPQSPAVHQKLSAVYEKLNLSTDAAREKKLAASVEPKQAPASEDPQRELAPDFTVTKMGSTRK